MASNTKSKTRTTAKKQGFQFKWWMGLGLVIIIAVVGVVIVRFSNASSYTNGCWISGGYESSAASCEQYQKRYGVSPTPAAAMKSSNTNSYPNGCDIYLSNRGAWSYERDPGSCQNAANQGKQVRQPNHPI